MPSRTDFEYLQGEFANQLVDHRMIGKRRLADRH
jgi:hypothetical protein